MLKGTFPIEKFKKLETPFYYYDIKLLQETLNVVKAESGKYGYHVHYAIKANANPRLLSLIAQNGFGADCVSGGEVKAALEAGFPNDKIVFAGVGKADWEINLGLDNDIFCFNVESIAELEVIEELAAQKNKTAPVALRINPEVDAHTHAKITTGMKENKFGINLSQLPATLDRIKGMQHIKLIGIHCHIGSQITDMSAFRNLVIRMNEIQEELEKSGTSVENLNVELGDGDDLSSHGMSSDNMTIVQQNENAAENDAEGENDNMTEDILENESVDPSYDQDITATQTVQIFFNDSYKIKDMKFV